MKNSGLFNSFRSLVLRLKGAPRRTPSADQPPGLPLEACLRPQAHVDGELTRRQAFQTAEKFAGDPVAISLHAELILMKSTLAEYEPERPIPQSRGLYWRNIERAIESQIQRRESRYEWGWRLVPACCLALGVLTVLWSKPQSDPVITSHASEVEIVSAQMGAVAFHDYQAGMTLVWHYPRAENPSLPSPDLLFQ